MGRNIFGTDFIDIELRLGGAFVCGEETALMASEGMREPRPRPPFPSKVFGKPTR